MSKLLDTSITVLYVLLGAAAAATGEWFIALFCFAAGVANFWVMVRHL